MKLIAPNVPIIFSTASDVATLDGPNGFVDATNI